jgi:uncharacterized protein (TIGR02444 family)
MDERAEPPSTETLWSFTLALYPREGVSPAVIALQDRHGVHVNLLFLACWLGASGRGRLDDAGVGRARAISGAWQGEVVEVLREVRRRLKDWTAQDPDRPSPPDTEREDYRKKVVGLEIEGERLEQGMLEAAFDGPVTAAPGADSRAGDAAHNLHAYLAQLGVELDGDDRGHLATLLGATFPELERPAIESLAAG